MPESLGARIQDIDGVKQTAPVIARYVILDLHGRKQATTLVGYQPGAMGGELNVVGLVSGARTWMTGMAFVSIDSLQALQRTPDVASFILHHAPCPPAPRRAPSERCVTRVEGGAHR